jgi:hypothetical protein
VENGIQSISKDGDYEELRANKTPFILNPLVDRLGAITENIQELKINSVKALL